MRLEDVRNILPGILAGNGEDARLVEWCKEHLVTVLKSAGIHQWIPPYYGRVSEFTQDYMHTWENGYTGKLTQSYMDVFESASNTCIGRVPISSFKYKAAVCEIIKRNGNWYLMTASENGVQIYTLPDLKIVAEHYVDSLKITDIWCPRLHSRYITYEFEGKESSFYYCDLDDEIESSDDEYPDPSQKEWDSAPFAFVDAYDAYSSGPGYVTFLDLRHFTDGIIKSKFLMEKPSHLNLRQSIDISDWSLEYPVIQLAKNDYCSTVDLSKPAGCGWNHAQLDHILWAGADSDPRQHWGKHKDCIYLSEKLGVDYNPEFKNRVVSVKEAVQLSKSNPTLLKQIVLHGYLSSEICDYICALSGLAKLLPSDEIADVLGYIAQHSSKKTVQQRASSLLNKSKPFGHRMAKLLGVH